MTLAFLMFLNCICIGIITSLTSDICILIKKVFKNNFIICLTLDFIIYFLGVTFIFLLSAKMNYNIFAFYEILGFLIGIILEKISCSKIFANFFDLLYNKIIKIIKNFKITKVGKVFTR